ncbi:MAG: sugar ABC transporter substrate-binding protein [Clostridium sp.]|nr:sugar ABC transporter substrate-binding protein [Clostridium sp.]MDU7084233.1 sugar ABC transporter substrate-binding protein [Clostridium sp.]
MKKRVIAMLLATIFGVSMFTGCSTKKDNLGSKQQTYDEIEFTGENDYGWDVPKETFEFSYYKKATMDPDKEAKYLEKMNAYLLENFNLRINKMMYDSDGEERLNLMLASNSYPEVITGLSKTDVIKLKEQGKIIDMAPYIDEYGSNIKGELGDLYPRFEDEEGKVYGLPYSWGLLPIPDYSAHIRWDWYQEMGAPKFETPYEYYEILKKMVEDHPTNENGEKVYALSWNDTSSINTIAGIWGLKDGYKEDANHNLTHWINTEEGHEFTKFYNTVYRDGMLDPDAFTNKFEDWKTKFSTERVVGHIGPWWQSWNAGHEVWQATDENWTEDMRYVQVKVKDEKAEQAYLSPKNVNGEGYTVITDKCKNPEMVTKVLDLMMTPNGTRLFAWGVPNEEDSNWNFTDGQWSFNEKAKEEIINATYDYEKHYYSGQNRIWLSHPQGQLSDDPSTNAWIDQCFNDDAKWKKMINENLADTVYDNSAMYEIVFLPNDDVTIKQQQVEDTINMYWAKTVLSNSDDEFEKNYKVMKDALNKAGVNELQEYMSTEYNKILEKWEMK